MKKALYFTGPDIPNISKEDITNILARSSANRVLFNPSTSVFSDIVNSGQLQYLTNKDLRRSLSNWEATLKSMNWQEQVVESYRSQIKQLSIKEANLVEHFAMEGVMGMDTLNSGLSDFNFNTPDLLADQEFENLLAYKIVSTSSLVVQYIELQSNIQSILKRIDAQINK